MNVIVSQVGEICRYSERHRLSTQGQNPLGRNLKDIPWLWGEGGTFESTTPKPMQGVFPEADVQIDFRGASLFKEMERGNWKCLLSRGTGAAAVVSELQVSVFPASTELKRVLTDLLSKN